MADPEIHRIVECDDGEFELEWSPRFLFGEETTTIRNADGGWIAEGKDARLVLCGVNGLEPSEQEYGPVLTGTLRMHSGNRRAIVTRWDSDHMGGQVEDSDRLLDRTIEIWREWVCREGVTGRRQWAGEWLPMVVRSALVFKMLCHADTGAFVAAPTASLPELIGGVRNWDYRYVWIRDASMTAQAMIAAGHENEALELLEWMEEVSEAGSEEHWHLQIMYGLHGERELPERQLAHFEGYRGSRPVNIGNGAAQ